MDGVGGEGEQAVGGGDPEGAEVVFGEVVDEVAVELGGVGGVEGEEVLAVEADQAALSGDPEEAVAGLEDGVDGVLGKAGLGLPGLPAVLAEGLGGGEGATGRGTGREDGQEAEGEKTGWRRAARHGRGFGAVQLQKKSALRISGMVQHAAWSGKRGGREHRQIRSVPVGLRFGEDQPAAREPQVLRLRLSR